MTFRHLDSETLMMGLRDVAVSSGSACTSASIQASHVLRAIGLSEEDAHSSIRFGLGRFNTEEEMDFVAARMVEVVSSLREISSDYADIG
jgi:cysteine desulfurase